MSFQPVGHQGGGGQTCFQKVKMGFMMGCMIGGESHLSNSVLIKGMNHKSRDNFTFLCLTHYVVRWPYAKRKSNDSELQQKELNDPSYINDRLGNKPVICTDLSNKNIL